MYCLWGEPLADTAEQIARVEAEARGDRPAPAEASRSRSARSSGRPRRRRGSARTTSSSRIEARRGRRTRGSARRRVARRTPARSDCSTSPRGASASTARCGPATAPATGGSGNSNALVGTPETVAAALMDYVAPRRRHPVGARLRHARGRGRVRSVRHPDRARRGREARPGYGARLSGARELRSRGHQPRVEHRVEIAESRLEDVEPARRHRRPELDQDRAEVDLDCERVSAAAPTITGTTVTAAS